MLSVADRGLSAQWRMSGLNKMSQLVLTVLFALALSFLTFAASFAEVPRSEILMVTTQE